MKFYTNRQYKQLIKKYEKKIDGARRSGYEQGYKQGLYEGTTANKKGILFTSVGMFYFEDGVTKIVETQHNKEGSPLCQD